MTCAAACSDLKGVIVHHRFGFGEADLVDLTQRWIEFGESRDRQRTGKARPLIALARVHQVIPVLSQVGDSQRSEVIYLILGCQIVLLNERRLQVLLPGAHIAGVYRRIGWTIEAIGDFKKRSSIGARISS